jgi:hypothetical protein
VKYGDRRVPLHLIYTVDCKTAADFAAKFINQKKFLGFPFIPDQPV